MNGQDKEFLDKRLTKLETKFSERWDAHTQRAKELKDYLKDRFSSIERSFLTITNRMMDLPCKAHKSEISWMKWSIRGIICIIMTVSVLFIRAWVVNGHPGP